MATPKKLLYAVIFITVLLPPFLGYAGENKIKPAKTERSVDYVPDHVSKPMQEYLKNARPFSLGKIQTVEDWINFRKNLNASAKEGIDKIQKAWGYESKPSSIAGVPVVWITPEEFIPDNKDKVLIYLHSGGYVFGSADDTPQPASLAKRLGIKAISIDYRLAPEHPFPAALEDTVAVYKELLKTYPPKNIAVTGFSSGGGLALASVLKARDMGLPLPAAVGLFAPWTDVDKIGDTYHTLEGISPLLHYEKNTRMCMEAYVGENDRKNPYISPVYGNYAKGFPPAMIITGTRDMFLSNCSRLQEALLRADQPVELIVFEAMGHIFSMFYGSPEAEEAAQYMADFISRNLE